MNRETGLSLLNKILVVSCHCAKNLRDVLTLNYAQGGGIFEDTAFYDACDEMGLLVWQDFLFACGNYPANEDFLALVKREATENVKRKIISGYNKDYSANVA